MNKIIFNYPEFVSGIKKACECKKYLACMNNDENPDAKWLQKNNCLCPDGDKNKPCRLLESMAKYEEIYGNQNEIEIEDTAIYKEYLSKFHFDDIEVELPEKLSSLFDYNLLCRLVVASFSSDYSLSNPEFFPAKLLPELKIHVVSGDSSVTRSLTEIDFVQTMRLFYIYMEECFNLFQLAANDEREEKTILQERMLRQKKWAQVHDRVKCKFVIGNMLETGLSTGNTPDEEQLLK